MTKQEALDYCYTHRNKYISDLYACGEDGVEQFDCLIAILEDDTITPDEIKNYGMDY